MKILGLDLGTHTGWCACTKGADGLSWEHGVLNFTKCGQPMPLEERLAAFEADLSNTLLGSDCPDAIVYEVAHMRGGPATRSALGMETVLRLVAFKHGVQVHGLHSATLKKFSTGNGKAFKEMMVIAAVELSKDLKITDDNEADAICLANWGVKNGVMSPWGRIEFPKRVVKKSTKKRKEAK